VCVSLCVCVYVCVKIVIEYTFLHLDLCQLKNEGSVVFGFSFGVWIFFKTITSLQIFKEYGVTLKLSAPKS
jgi:hypothetical protein